jgi:hypothetical protein
MANIGDIYFTSLFINLICNLNKNEEFYYYSIIGDIFFENIKNIKRFGNIEKKYSSYLLPGYPPEYFVNSEILKILKDNKMEAEGAKKLNINNEDILFINTWCGSKILYYAGSDFDINNAINPYKNMIETINYEYNLNLNYKLENPKEILNNLIYYNNLFKEKYSTIDLNDTVFIFNFIQRSVYLNINILNKYISELSKTKKIILAYYNPIFDDNENIKFIDKDFNIIPNPSCSNLIEIWEIAIKCNKVIIIQSGSSWTFLHKVNEIKENQLYIFYGNLYIERLNNNINLLLGENKNLIGIIN